jgi:hypothetical protein
VWLGWFVGWIGIGDKIISSITNQHITCVIEFGLLLFRQIFIAEPKRVGLKPTPINRENLRFLFTKVDPDIAPALLE